ncbi:SGNH/GDSL hydrolase family protein [Flavobacteriaceae bacterium MHTCC 0001]
MKLEVPLLWVVLLFFTLFSCSANQENNPEKLELEKETVPDDTATPSNLKILSLGDSYTIGASVCQKCRFPEQLKDSIKEKTENLEIELKVIATSGWTTTALKNAIANENLDENYDLCTLLIGVNNQYQRKPFDLFEKEFPELVGEAIKYSKGKRDNLIVVSIPDYAFTPFGGGNSNITEEINKYNTFIENYCKQYSITYIYITDITRQGLVQTELVASDGLHPSALAYSKFVSRILPEALEKIGYNVD